MDHHGSRVLTRSYILPLMMTIVVVGTLAVIPGVPLRRSETLRRHSYNSKSHHQLGHRIWRRRIVTTGIGVLDSNMVVVGAVAIANHI